MVIGKSIAQMNEIFDLEPEEAGEKQLELFGKISNMTCADFQHYWKELKTGEPLVDPDVK